MPNDFFDRNDAGFGPGTDFGHDHNDSGDDHSLFGHGGFVNLNHFEHDGFFNSPKKTAGGDTSGLSAFLTYVLYGGGIVLIGLITCFILFS